MGLGSARRRQDGRLADVGRAADSHTIIDANIPGLMHACASYGLPNAALISRSRSVAVAAA
ncbi:hypothetical protein [Nonomuraea sp. bgisy101]|uniref:hypothetical protein n=1 Tax=Nonomuraea sp. bgisy101 TaxID=3413784 RepID=UPI003D74BED9